MARVGFLGTGAMGARMAARLISDGHDLVVWNRSPERAQPLATIGATIAQTPRAVAKEADFVISMVRDDAASKAVWLDDQSGALGAMQQGAIAIDSSTLSLAWSRDLAKRAIETGVHFLDAPVAGSRPQAEAGQLIYFVGGSTEALNRANPLLRAMGAAVHHAGENGAGAAIKLAVNTLLGVQVCAIAEVLALLDASGLDAATGCAILSETPVASAAAKGAAAAMLSGSFAPMFPVSLVEKDFCYALALAEKGDTFPMAQAACDVFRQAIREGLSEENLTSVVKLFREART